MKLKLSRLTIGMPIALICLISTGVVTKSITQTVPTTVAAHAVSQPISTIATPSTPSGMRPVVETKTKLVNYTVMNPVYQTHQKEVNYTVMKPVYETRQKMVTYTVCTMIPEVRTKTVNYTTCRMERETRQKAVEYSAVRYEPIDDGQSSAE